MSQIRYNIIESLTRKDNYIRGLAKEIGTNQTMISRRMNELLAENIVDFRKEGKNKVFFLKDSLESMEEVKINEHKKVVTVILAYPALRSIFEKIQKNKNIKLAILFGSYAKNTAVSKSDIDIFIETKKKGIKKSVELIDSRIQLKIGKFDEKSFLGKEIKKKHVIIKGVEIFYEIYR